MLRLRHRTTPACIAERPHSILVFLDGEDGFRTAVEACLANGYPKEAVKDTGRLAMFRNDDGHMPAHFWLDGDAEFVINGTPETNGSIYFEHTGSDGVTREFELPMSVVGKVRYSCSYKCRS